MSHPTKRAGIPPVRETEAYLDDMETPPGAGREGGRLAREIGTRDALKRATQDVPGATRVRKSDEAEDGTGSGEDAA